MRISNGNYLKELCKNNKAYKFNKLCLNLDKYYIVPSKKVAIFIDEPQEELEVTLPEYEQDLSCKRNPLTENKEFRLIETKTVLHSHSADGGGRGNSLFLLSSLYLNYYDFIAEGDTLRFKSFRPLDLLSASKEKEKYILILGSSLYRDYNYFFEYIPKKYRK